MKPDKVVPYSGGNVFSAYHGSREGSWRGPYAEIAWLNDSTLQVAYICDAVVTNRNNAYGRIDIEYLALNTETANQVLDPTA